jgi:serine/threonine protein kinase
LKPENIFYEGKENSRLKLIDFGTSLMETENDSGLEIKYFLALEDFAWKISEKSDFCSLGAILYFD